MFASTVHKTVLHVQDLKETAQSVLHRSLLTPHQETAHVPLIKLTSKVNVFLLRYVALANSTTAATFVSHAHKTAPAATTEVLVLLAQPLISYLTTLLDHVLATQLRCSSRTELTALAPLSIALKSKLAHSTEVTTNATLVPQTVQLVVLKTAPLLALHAMPLSVLFQHRL